MSDLVQPVEARDHVQGPGDARVTLIEYSDFQCPYCREAHQTIRQVEEALSDTVRFVYRHFPLQEIHPRAVPAALAAEAAGLQGRFWEMHDTLFQNQDALDDDSLVIYATDLGLDANKFVEDMEADAVFQRVQDDFTGGLRAGVGGTPTFFINGDKYTGPHDYDSLVAALQDQGVD